MAQPDNSILPLQGLERRVLEVQEQLLREHEAVAAEKLAAQQEYVAEYNGLATE